jgi:molybdenum cofactor synthesis domain-containing protein
VNKVFNMPTAEILTVGSELTEGAKTNTNATWLAKKITNEGVQVTRITSVSDEPEHIIAAVKEGLTRKPNLLITTGGLGPTPDDKTLGALAQATGRRLSLDQNALALVRKSYSRMRTEGLIKSKKITPAREKMAYLPKGAKSLSNPVGAAPGVQLKCGGTLIICLPGVPAEMRAIFNQHVKGELPEIGERVKSSAELSFRDADESSLAPLLSQLPQKFPGIEVRSYPSKNRVRIVIVAASTKKARAAKEALSKLVRELR